MSDQSSANPYAPPEASSVERIRKQDGKYLACAVCQQTAISVMNAFLRHPQLAVVCPNCGARHRLTFANASQLRFHAAVLPAVGLGVIAILLALRNQTYRTVEFFVTRITRHFQWTPSRSLSSAIEATVLIMVLVTPVLLAAFWAFRVQIRMIAREGILQERVRKAKR